jgi:hypothetical protein
MAFVSYTRSLETEIERVETLCQHQLWKTEESYKTLHLKYPAQGRDGGWRGLKTQVWNKLNSMLIVICFLITQWAHACFRGQQHTCSVWKGSFVWQPGTWEVCVSVVYGCHCLLFQNDKFWVWMDSVLSCGFLWNPNKERCEVNIRRSWSALLLAQHLSGGTEENHKSLLGMLVFCLGFKPEILKYFRSLFSNVGLVPSECPLVMKSRSVYSTCLSCPYLLVTLFPI